MNPENGQRVKCFMRTGMVLEGIVEIWTDVQAVLRSLDGQSLMIVHRAAEDIMLTKIMFGEETSEIPEEKPKHNPPKPETIKQKLQELQTTDDPELQKKSVAELRDMIVAQEKQIIANKTREHFGSTSAPKMVRYGSPSTYLPKAK